MLPINFPPPPRLPDAGETYTRNYFDGLINVLRLYFNRVSNAFSVLFGPLGGATLESPHALLMSNQDQANAGVTSENLIQFDQVIFARGVEVRNDSEIWFEQPGQYLVCFSLQVTNRDNSAHTFEVWAKQNGDAYPLSNTRYDVPVRKSATEWAHVVPSIAGIFTVADPDVDHLSIAWWSDGTGVFLEHYAGATSPTRPDTPSVILTVSTVSRLPA